MNLKRYLKEKSAHISTGVLSGFSIINHPIFSVMLTLLFILYELSEFYIRRDTYFPEIKEYTVGFIFGYLIFVILRLFVILSF